jgi:RNA polymerase sigma-70 factor (ECF subfamily)
MAISSPSTSPSLLERLCAGDQEAWKRLLALYTPLLRAWLYPAGLQVADADDVIQNALAVVCRKLPHYRHNGQRGAFRRWLRQIVGHVLLEFRRATGRHICGGDDLLAELEDPSSELNRRWDAEHDRYLLRGLLHLVRGEFSPSTWEAFRRTALEGEPAAQVAEALGLSVNAVHIARSRVLARLRREAEGIFDVP